MWVNLHDFQTKKISQGIQTNLRDIKYVKVLDLNSQHNVVTKCLKLIGFVIARPTQVL